MPWQKLSLSNLRDDRGSAAVDFLIVLIPTSLLCLPLVGLTSLFHKTIVNQQLVYEVARFASLADTTAAAAELFRGLTDSTSSVRYFTNPSGCVVAVTKRTPFRVALWHNDIDIVSEARVKCEVE